MSVLQYSANPRVYLAALNAAQVDADERCRPLLDLRADLTFHGDALHGLPQLHSGRSYDLRHAILQAVKEVDACIVAEIGAVNADHNLTDGTTADSPLNTVKQMVADHRDGLKRIAA